MDATTYRLDALRAQFDLTTPRPASYAVEGAKVIRRLEDPVEVERFVGRLHEETGFTRETLLEQVGSAPPRRTRRGAWTPPSPTEWRARGAERLKRRTAPCAPSGSWPRSLPRASACRRG